MTKKDRRKGNSKFFEIGVQVGTFEDRRKTMTEKKGMPAKTWTKVQEAKLIEALVAAQGRELDWADFLGNISSLLTGRGKKTEAQVKSKCSAIRTRAKKNGVSLEIPRKPAHLSKNIDDSHFLAMISGKR